MQTHLPLQSSTNADPSLHGYPAALSETIKKLVAIFGQDITYARLSHIPEIQFSKERTSIQVTGTPVHITHSIQTLFSSLSQDVVDTLILPHLKNTPLSPITSVETTRLS